MRATHFNQGIGRFSPALCWAALLFMAFGCTVAFAAEVMPPKPKLHFNDYANVTRPDTGERLNQALEQFERDTSSQIVAAVFPKMQSDSSIEDYTRRVAEAWGVGRKDKNNGAVLFVFVQDRKMFIQTGYGLEGAIPDATAKRIVADEITPRFRAGDYDGGMVAGVNALMSAARGEYKGSGRTVAEGKGGRGMGAGVLLLVLLFFVIAGALGSARRATTFGRRGRSSWGGPVIWSGGGGGWSGGGGGGGFSGGGGSFGGGGAGGSW